MTKQHIWRALGLVAIVVALASCDDDPAKDPNSPVGKPAPAFSVRSLGSGKMVSLKSLKGQVVLLDFWATWCQPCHEAMPVVQQAFDQYGKRGLTVLGISAEEKSVVESFDHRRPFTYPLFVDEDGSANNAYNITTIPNLVLIDRKGKVVAFDIPPSFSDLNKEIQKAMQS